MRAIIGIISHRAAKAVGKRAIAVEVEKPKPTIESVLGAPVFQHRDGTPSDLVAERREVRSEYALVMGGGVLRGPIDWQQTVVDSERIFVYSWWMEDSSE